MSVTLPWPCYPTTSSTTATPCGSEPFLGKGLPWPPWLCGVMQTSLTFFWALHRLGLAYAGSNREDVLTLLLPVMGDSKSSMEVGSRAGCATRVPDSSWRCWGWFGLCMSSCDVLCPESVTPSPGGWCDCPGLWHDIRGLLQWGCHLHHPPDHYGEVRDRAEGHLCPVAATWPGLEPPG